ncbi:MAG: CHASE domain-containing protein [Oceanococcaceae bacterium]
MNPSAGIQSILGFKLHFVHWLVLGISLVLTVVAWSIASSQQADKQQQRFDTEAAKLVDRVRERMAQYEGGLLGGVAYLYARGTTQALKREEWRGFARALELPTRYPGIHGIGVIEHIADAELPTYRERLRTLYPDIQGIDLHPDTGATTRWPISFIEPIDRNLQAVGLDIGFENNRRTAAEAATAQQQSRITGPIVLVQDDRRTPGFLFFAPFRIQDPDDGSVYQGLVYAPFVVRDLLAGTLASSKRHVTFRLRDGEDELYAETADNTAEFDPLPMFQKQVSLPLYGRNWQFIISSNQGFREHTDSNLPATILIGGLTVDFLLLMIFAVLVQAHRSAQSLAKDLSEQHAQAQDQLRQRNDELIQFNYRVSHDLVAPMRTISGLVDILRIDIEDRAFEDVERTLEQMQSEVAGQIRVITSIFHLCESDLRDEPFVDMPLKNVAEALFEQASREEGVSGVELALNFADDFQICAQPARLNLALGNLISNALRFRRPEEPQHRVDISAELRREEFLIRVRDNGMGIPAESIPRIFDLFYRAHSGSRVGAGLGTYIVRKSVEQMGGQVSVYSDGNGSCFEISWPQPTSGDRAPAIGDA